MLVVWEWESDATRITDDPEYVYKDGDTETNDNGIDDNGIDSSPESSDSGEAESEMPHTVLFKCIGDSGSQDTLRLCRNRKASGCLLE